MSESKRSPNRSTTASTGFRGAPVRARSAKRSVSRAIASCCARTEPSSASKNRCHAAPGIRRKTEQHWSRSALSTTAPFRPDLSWRAPPGGRPVRNFGFVNHSGTPIVARVPAQYARTSARVCGFASTSLADPRTLVARVRVTAPSSASFMSVEVRSDATAVATACRLSALIEPTRAADAPRSTSGAGGPCHPDP